LTHGCGHSHIEAGVISTVVSGFWVGVDGGASDGVIAILADLASSVWGDSLSGGAIARPSIWLALFECEYGDAIVPIIRRKRMSKVPHANIFFLVSVTWNSHPKVLFGGAVDGRSECCDGSCDALVNDFQHSSQYFASWWRDAPQNLQVFSSAMEGCLNVWYVWYKVLDINLVNCLSVAIVAIALTCSVSIGSGR